MVTTTLDRLPMGTAELLAEESSKTARERRRLPDAVSSRDLYRDVIRIAWPSMVELLLTSLVGMADMMMVGAIPGKGDQAIAAVSLSNQPKFIFISLMIALNVGVTAVVARYRGAGEHEKANTALRQGLFFSFLWTIAAGILGTVFAEPLVRFMANDGLSAGTLSDAVDYLRIQMIFFFTMGITATFTAALRGTGNSRVPMIYNMTANAVNIVFNYLLINGHFGFPALGVRGASIATIIGQTVALVMAIRVNAGGKYYFTVKPLDFLHFRLEPDILKKIVNVGVPSLLEQLILRVGIILFTRQVTPLGDLLYTTHTICMNIQSMSFMLGQALAVSSTSLVGQSLGKRRPDMAEHYSRRCVYVGLITSAALGILFGTLGKYIVGFYSSTEAVRLASIPVMIIIGCLQPIQGPTFILAGSLRGAGDTRSVALVTAIGILLVRPIMGWLTIEVLAWGLMGAWSAISVDQAMRCLVLYALYRRGKWKKVTL